MTFIIRWIGKHVDIGREFYPEPIDGCSNMITTGTDEHMLDYYGLTVDGLAICVDAFCIRLASYKSINVILF